LEGGTDVNCKWTFSDWQNYVSDHHAEHSKKRQMEHHLSSCSHCITLYEQAITDALSILESDHGDAPDLSDEIMQAIQPTKHSVRKPVSFLHYGIAASIAFLLLQVGFFEGVSAYAGKTSLVSEQSDQMMNQAATTSTIWIEYLYNLLKLK
jgi:predicted anti-sigma-YlaC factor YlaD